MNDIMSMLDAMSVEELKTRLAAYMMADAKLAPRPVAVEVRQNETHDRGGRFQVLIIMDDGSEREVMFRDRQSRLVYIYTLMHPQGYQRRSLVANNYKGLRELYSKLYFASSEHLMKSISKLGFDQYFSQAVAQSRRFVRDAIGKTEDFEIAMPQRHGGKTLIACASKEDAVIIDNYLK